jgi:hypothetical protein
MKMWKELIIFYIASKGLLPNLIRGVYSGHFPPPWRGGGKKRGTFWSLGKKIGPSRKKISELQKKFKFLLKTFSQSQL